MKTNPISHPEFNRPLLKYAQVLDQHLRAAAEHVDAQTINHCKLTVKELSALQESYELLPGREPNRWFLSAGYENAHKSLLKRCACLKRDVDEIRSSFPRENKASKFHGIDLTLRELTSLLDSVADDLSCLSRRTNISEPAAPSAPGNDSLEDIFHSI